jgi:hypothetical protein
MGTDNDRTAIEHLRISGQVSSIRNLILNDARVQADPEREMSILGRTLGRFAEGTLGDDVVIPGTPVWQDAVLPALKKLPEKDRALIATGVVLDLYSSLYQVRLGKLVSFLAAAPA